MRKSFPICLVLDLDGTIIGDVDNILKDFEIRETIALSLQKPHLKQTKNDLFDRFEHGLLRPHFLKFVELIQSHSNVYVYIYTASSDSWAQYIIPMIESYISKRLQKRFRFQRPLFTRSSCKLDPLHDTYVKSIKHIKPTLDKATRQTKYPIIFVDNNMTLDPKESRYIFHCDSYEPLIPIDFTRKLNSQDMNTSVFVQTIHSMVCQCQNASCIDSTETVLGSYYKRLGESFSHYAKQKRTYKKDEFWLDFAKALSTFIKKYEKTTDKDKYFTNPCKAFTKFYDRVRKSI